MLTDLHALEAVLAPLGWRKSMYPPGIVRCEGERFESIRPHGVMGRGVFEWHAVGVSGSKIGALDELAEYVKSKEGTP